MTDWNKALQPLIKKYKGKKHPLDYYNNYQLVIMVIFSARDTVQHINKLAPPFFEKYPNMTALSKADEKDLLSLMKGITGYNLKAKSIIKLAKQIGNDKNIPLTLDELSALPFIGRKSANVILREAGAKAEGIMVDLHVMRVAPRLGIADAKKPDDVERQLMEIIKCNYWSEAGMSISFLGREICRPKDPRCEECVMNTVCEYARLKNVKPK